MTAQTNIWPSFAEAFIEVQGKIVNPQMDSEVKFGSAYYKYASLEAVERSIKAAIALVDPKYRLYYLQAPITKDGISYLETTIGSLSGETKTSCYHLNSEANFIVWKEKGGAITYVKRYVLCGIFGISGEEDGDVKGIQDEVKLKEISAYLIKLSESDKDIFWKILGVRAITELSSEKYDLAIKKLIAMVNSSANKEIK